MTTTFVTTSWDDGHRLDPRLADLLDAHRMPATFYIAPANIEFARADRLSAAGIAELATRFEIGGHTRSHLRLPKLRDDHARDEILAGKQDLENIVGKSLISFCYPRGEYRAAHVQMVAEAGFRLARTVRRSQLDPGQPLELATTVNAYTHRVDGPLVVRKAGLRLGKALRMYFDWADLALAWFDECLRSGGVFHLWGHSWEIDARADWHRLERVLDRIAGQPGVTYITNGGLVAAGAIT